MTKTFRDNCDEIIVQQTSCEPRFSDVHMQLKMYFFVPFLRPCMHHKYGGISECHACKDGVWCIILDSKLYTTCPGERGLVVMTHQVQCNIPTFVALLRKKCTSFSNRALTNAIAKIPRTVPKITKIPKSQVVQHKIGMRTINVKNRTKLSVTK